MRESERAPRYKETDKLREKCAVFGAISFTDQDVSADVVLGLASLQHRGQDGSGLATFHSYTKRFSAYRERGLVGDVFSHPDVFVDNNLRGNLVIGHNRYATTGPKEGKRGLQPLIIEKDGQSLTIAHNGNIPQGFQTIIRRELPDDLPLVTGTDTELLGWKIMLTKGRNWEEKIRRGLADIHGGFALVMGTDDGSLIAVRDRLANRPLWMGRTADGAAFSSETHGFERLHMDSIEEVKAGQMVIAKAGEVKKVQALTSTKTARCLIEPVYFGHPLSQENGMENEEIRERMGMILAREYPMPAVDIICGIPESGLAIANGYAQELGRHAESVIIKDRYGKGIRTFIKGSQPDRKAAIDGKFSYSRRVEGKRIGAFDDSVIRGNTTRKVVERLRERGAKEVHIFSGAPEVKDDCDLGVDIASQNELIALEQQGENYRSRSREEIARLIGADSINYLSLDGLVEASGRKKGAWCTHCFTGEHPIFDAKSL